MEGNAIVINTKETIMAYGNETMPKIGKYDYPFFGPRIVIESIDKIRDSKVSTISGVADALGHKTQKSGGFLMKMASMNKYYGVVSRRGDAMEFTSLGKRIAYPADENEREEAISEMVLRVPLFRDLYERLGEVFDRDKFFVHLGELAGVDRDVATAESSKIRNLYEEALPYLRRKESSVPSGVEAKTQKVVTRVEAVQPGSLNVPEGMILLGEYGKPPIIVPAQGHFINSLIKYLQGKAKSADEMEEPEKKS